MTSSTFLTLAEQSAPGAGSGITTVLVPMILMFVMFHFLLIRPQKKRQQELQKQIDSMQIGDGVVTSGGIHGIIANKSDHTITVKVADNVKIKIDKVAVARVVSKDRLAPGESQEA